MPLNSPLAPLGKPPAVVLDTNVVLDWLVFHDPSIAPLVAALDTGALCWHATAAMRDELASVLERGGLDAWRPDVAALWGAWDRWSRAAEAVATPHPGSLRCTDPDDQKFIDLALQLHPATLLTRDRAVLRLARHAAAHGVHIATPSAWAANAHARPPATASPQ